MGRADNQPVTSDGLNWHPPRDGTYDPLPYSNHLNRWEEILVFKLSSHALRSNASTAAGFLGSLVIAAAVTGCGSSSEPAANVTRTVTAVQTVKAVQTVTTLRTVAQKPATPRRVSATASADSSMTSGQRNALSSAKDYVDMGGISRRDLIEQLSSSAGEGYSESEATFAADHVGANWYSEAVQSAKEYLQMGGMSRTGLIEQLSSSAGAGFTEAQAVYAANKVY